MRRYIDRDEVLSRVREMTDQIVRQYDEVEGEVRDEDVEMVGMLHMTERFIEQEPIDESVVETEISEDGTLMFSVPSDMYVGRIIVNKAGTHFCEVFYPE